MKQRKKLLCLLLVLLLAASLAPAAFAEFIFYWERKPGDNKENKSL